ncbi:MAG: hypothetical protein ACKV2O_08860 [Acidimicrobiales bacterium]
MMAGRTPDNGGASYGMFRGRRSAIRGRLDALALLPLPPPDLRFADELLVRLVTNRPPVAPQPVPLSLGAAGAAGAAGAGAGPVAAETQVVADAAALEIVGGVPDGVAGPRRGRKKPAVGRLAVAAVAAAAAMLLLLPPTLDLVESDLTRAELATASLASQVGTGGEVRVGPGGALLDRAGRPWAVDDGAATLTCSAAMTFEDAAGAAYRCEAGESVAIRVERATVVWSSAMPTDSDLGALLLQEPPLELPLRWSWSPFDGPNVGRFAAYELVRGATNEPALADSTAVEVVTHIEDIGRTTFEEPLAPDRDVVYQVRAVDGDGRPLAMSNAVQVSVDPSD